MAATFSQTIGGDDIDPTEQSIDIGNENNIYAAFDGPNDKGNGDDSKGTVVGHKDIKTQDRVLPGKYSKGTVVGHKGEGMVKGMILEAERKMTGIRIWGNTRQHLEDGIIKIKKIMFCQINLTLI